MATVSGACVINKMSGLLQIHEDTNPSKLIWKAIDQDKSLEVPLNKLSKLQASPDLSPKMLLRLFYTLLDSPDVKDIKLIFNNRQTMSAVKEALQSIVARQKTVINDAPPRESTASASGTPAPDASKGLSPSPGDPLDFSTAQSLSEASLLKNRQLQQKLLLEDKTLRNIFTQSVIKYKLSPTIFWLSRVSQLRTYALTISQHRGPYNVLSTIKPVATSDNQVNVNVTRNIINEIFDTYPVIRRAYNELVPEKLNEGEFWSRFFNSKLFRRLRGDKINTSNTRGDIVIDKYLYVDADFVEREELAKKATSTLKEHNVNKFIDLYGNEVDNSQKLGMAPDFTMKFSNEEANQNAGSNGAQAEPTGPGKHENEMVILMKNMNKLSNKMIGFNDLAPEQGADPAAIVQEMEEDLKINDLEETDELTYVQLNLDTQVARQSLYEKKASPGVEDILKTEVDSFLGANFFVGSENGIDLNETYQSKGAEINKASLDLSALVKHNFRTFKLMHNLRDHTADTATNLLPDEDVQELITFNITMIEFLLHFWSLFLGGGNPAQLKKLFTNLRNCQTELSALEKKIKEHVENHDQLKDNERLREKALKDVDTCIFPLTSALNKAVNDYVAAVRAASTEVNENGKRPLEA